MYLDSEEYGPVGFSSLRIDIAWLTAFDVVKLFVTVKCTLFVTEETLRYSSPKYAYSPGNTCVVKVVPVPTTTLLPELYVIVPLISVLSKLLITFLSKWNLILSLSMYGLINLLAVDNVALTCKDLNPLAVSEAVVEICFLERNTNLS